MGLDPGTNGYDSNMLLPLSIMTMRYNKTPKPTIAQNKQTAPMNLKT